MATYDLFTFAGHGNGDPGACANNYQEHERAVALTQCLKMHLATKGLNVHYGINNYKNILISGNTYKKKFGFSIHLNSSEDSSATGTEALVPAGEKEFTMENEILKGIEALGLRNRGLKSRDYNTNKWYTRTHGTSLNIKDYHGEIREAWSRGVSLSILEICFISNANDIKIFNANVDKIARIIANAILRYLKLPLVAEAPVKQTFYRVVAGSYTDRANAEKAMKELQSKGYNCFITTTEA